MSSIMNIDEEYRHWIEKITLKYRNSQIKAAIKVNVELLAFYWSLGRDIVNMQSQSKWGSKLLENVSKDLKKLLPDAKGFSKTNLFYITSFFSLYSHLATDDKTISQVEDQFTPQVGEQIAISQKYGITVQDLFSIPWGHHKLIIDKCGKSLEKACFYVKETLSNNWSRAILLNFIDSDLYSRQGGGGHKLLKNTPDSNGRACSRNDKRPILL